MPVLSTEKLDFGFHRNSTRRDTLKEDHLAKTYQKHTRPPRGWSRGTTLNAAPTSKFMMMMMITISIAKISIWSSALYKFQMAQLNEVELPF